MVSASEAASATAALIDPPIQHESLTRRIQPVNLSDLGGRRLFVFVGFSNVSGGRKSPISTVS